MSRALVAAGWSVELVTGSLGELGEETHAPTFFAGSRVQYLDYSDAVGVFAMGGSAIGAPVPMHPSFEDREGAPGRGVGGGARRAGRASFVGFGRDRFVPLGRIAPMFLIFIT